MPDHKHIPDLSEAYGKAHRAYGLAAAVLLAWELVGIEFTSTPLKDVNITLQSPAAIPYVLVTLVVYFGFRLTIEWLHSAEPRRSTWAAKVDFAVAHTIGATSLAVQSIQAISRRQIFSEERAIEGLAMFAVALSWFTVIWIVFAPGSTSRPPNRVVPALFGSAITAAGLLDFSVLQVAIATFTGVGAGLTAVAVSRTVASRSRQQPRTKGYQPE